jgi:hypothetical protein
MIKHRQWVIVDGVMDRKPDVDEHVSICAWRMWPAVCCVGVGEVVCERSAREKLRDT